MYNLQCYSLPKLWKHTTASNKKIIIVIIFNGWIALQGAIQPLVIRFSF